MIRSLRFRILAWYALSLTLTVASFGGFLYWRMRESRFAEMDLELRGAGQTLLASANALHEFDFQWDKPLGTIPEPWEFSPMGPPGGRGGERRTPRGFGGANFGPNFGGSGFGGPSFGGPGSGGPGGPGGRGGGPGGNRGFGERGFGEHSFEGHDFDRPGGPRNEMPGPPEGALNSPPRPRPELESKANEETPKSLDESDVSKEPPTSADETSTESKNPEPRSTAQASPPQESAPQEPPPERPFRGGRGGRDGHEGRDGHGPGGREFRGRGFGGGPGGRPEEGPDGESGFRELPPGLEEEFARKEKNVALPSNFERSVEAIEGEKPYFAIWRKNGTTLKTTATTPQQGPQMAKQLSLTPEGLIRSQEDYREIWIAGPYDSTILVRRKAGKLYNDLSQWLWGICGAGLGVLVIGMAGGWWMSYGVLESIRAMNYQASKLSEQNLSQRITLRGVDTELKGLAGTLNRAFARLESAFDRQRQFTGDASHELRTPLAVVMGNLELALQDQKLGADAKRSLEAALRAAKRMRGLTDQLLMLARADAGALEIKRSEFDLGDIVQECAELVRPMADKKHFRLLVDAPSTEIEGDAGLLSQVVINLLSNAILYNKSGGDVHVGISDVGNAVQLEVTDTGVGIPDEAKPRLFERFYRPDGSRNRGSGGNGLGLAISKSLVEAHGGRITFESEVGTGTEFRVLLPRC